MFRCLVCLTALLCASVPAQVKEVQVHLRDAAAVDTLRSLGLDAAGCCGGAAHPGGHARVLIHSPAEESVLRAAGFMPEVIQRDLEAFYRSRLTQTSGARHGPPGFAQGSMGGFFTESEVVAFLDTLQSQHPAVMAPKVSLGNSVEGRPIWMWKISDNPLADENEPEILIDGLHHAREPMTYMAACWLAKRLAEEYGSDPETTALVDERELFIVPIVNPDGLVHNQTTDPSGGGLWRKNRRLNAGGSFGVDLNRNYGHMWGLDNQGSSGSPTSQTYRGTAPFSEPETAAMRSFAESRDLAVAFSMHSYSNYFFIPPGYATGAFAPPPLDAQYDLIAQGTSTLGPGWTTGTPWQILYPANGTTQDWWYGDLYGGMQTWAFGCEIGSAQDGFWPPTNRIIPLAEDTFRYCIYLMKIAGPDMQLDSVTVLDSGGQLPGTWEPGEIISLTAVLRNRGTVPANATVSIETVSPHLIVNTPSVGGAAVPALGVTAMNPVVVSVSPSATPFTSISYDIVVSAPGSVTIRQTQTMTLSAPSLTITDMDFESPAGWTPGMPGDTAVTGIWTRQNPNGSTYQGSTFNPEDDHTPGAGVACWFTGQANPGQGAGTEDVDGTASLLSPIFDLSQVSDPQLRYWRWFATSGSNDWLEVGLSNDAGQTWVILETVQSNQNNWIEVNHDVEAHLPRTDSMRLYFRASDDPNDSLCEAAIDDLVIQGSMAGGVLSATGTAAIGTSVQLDLQAPTFPGRPFHLGVSESASQGIPIPPAGIAPLDLDLLFLSFPNAPSVFSGFSGTLNGQGAGTSVINVPAEPALAGFQVFVAGLVLEGTVPAVITSAVRLVVP